MWPREHKTPNAPFKISTQIETGLQVVTTKHYRITSETPIVRQDFARFAKVLESVPQLIRRHPLPLWAPGTDQPINIFICRDDASFQRAGGNAGAVGWWDGRNRRALIRGDYFLAPPRAGNSRLQPRPDQGLLVHEMIHMSMNQLLWRVPPWFSEGTAEYFSICHQGDGWYLFRDLDSMIRDHLRHAVSRNKVGDKYHLLPVAEILKLDHAGWLQTAQNQPSGNAYLPYATALLLTHYHFHGGAARRQKVTEHLTKLHKLSRRARPPAFPTEDPAEIQSRLTKYWAQRGLHFVFRAE